MSKNSSQDIKNLELPEFWTHWVDHFSKGAYLTLQWSNGPQFDFHELTAEFLDEYISLILGACWLNDIVKWLVTLSWLVCSFLQVDGTKSY